MPAPQPAAELSPSLVTFLQGMRPVTLATVDEDGWPLLSVISWVLARDSKTVRLAMDVRSRSVAAMRSRGQAVLQVYAQQTSFQIRGQARVIKEKMESVNFPQAVIELTVTDVRENFFFGSKMTADPAYQYTYDEAKARDLDAQVYGELKV